MILTSLLATHASILSCIKSTFAFALASSLIQCSSTTNRGIKLDYEIFVLLVNQYYCTLGLFDLFILILIFITRVSFLTTLLS